MKDVVYLTILFDYYEKLLEDKDRECFKNYYFDNLSLGEISDNLGISRNAIHKRLKKVEEEILSYEKAIGLYDKEQKVLSIIDDEKLKEKVKKIFD
ncbi:MAG: HTH domain-containing protein [Bacilli bacterium]|nr:HTH domain-containing protein [Bacilli bacterium]